jgi:hypothetical protein
MQRAVFKQVTPIRFQSQATRVVQAHGTGVQQQAVNDDVYHAPTSVLRVVVSVAANVVGGVLLLSSMFILPHVLAGFLG